MSRSGNRKSNFTAEPRRHGGKTEQGNKLTVEAQRRAENHLTFPIAGLYQGTGFSRAAKGKNIWASAPAFRNFIQTLRATLREIFDESAYDRFLQRTGTSHSVESYRAFMRDRESAMAHKPRCC